MSVPTVLSLVPGLFPVQVSQNKGCSDSSAILLLVRQP